MMTSSTFGRQIQLTMLCFCGAALLTGCSSSTNEQVVVPDDNGKQFSEVHEDYQDLKDRLGFDENFESTRKK